MKRTLTRSPRRTGCSWRATVEAMVVNISRLVATALTSASCAMADGDFPVLPNNGPSLDETGIWLSSNLPGLVVAEDGMTSITHTVSYRVHGCSINVNHRQTAYQTSGSAERTPFYTILFSASCP